MPKNFQKVTFSGSLGDDLAARLDLPSGPPIAYALFAHCFTCSKDIFAAARISEGLTRRGIAVLRFDFTGLGQSEGDFANTNFSSNVDDLVKAADFLRENYEAPRIMIGHSLGGAATVLAARQVEECVAVSTIGAPASAVHVTKGFAADLDQIKEEGASEVTLAGRKFTIQKQFIDDLEATNVAEAASNLRRALLVFHAPFDETVGIENAGELFSAAKHPKSFVSLDQADHLVSKKADAVYVADVLSSWASKYLPDAVQRTDNQGVKVEDGVVRVRETRNGKFQQIVETDRLQSYADEPLSFGGDDTGFSPYELLSAALGACTSMTIRMYADQKKWPLDRVTVQLGHDKIHAEDCVNCEDDVKGKIDEIRKLISIEGDLTPEQRERLLQIADKCPVHKTLHAPVSIVTTLDPNTQ